MFFFLFFFFSSQSIWKPILSISLSIFRDTPDEMTHARDGKNIAIINDSKRAQYTYNIHIYLFQQYH